MGATLFVKYDQDKDGVLNIEEVKNYAREEFDFDIPEEAVERIKSQLFRDSDGVGPKNFMQVRAVIGIARDEQRAEFRQKMREEQAAKEEELKKKREAELEEKKEQVNKRLKEIEELIKEKVEPAVTTVEEALKTLSEASDPVTQTTATTSLEMAIKAAEAEIIVSKEQLKAATVDVKVTGVNEAHMNVAIMIDGQVDKLATITLGFRETKKDALKIDLVARETYRVELVANLRAYAEAQSQTAETLFNYIASDGAETMSKADVKKFLQSNGKPVDDEKLEQVCKAACLTDAATSISDVQLTKDDFKRINRYYMLVVKEIVLTDNHKIDQSKQLRKFTVGEVLEVTEGPKLEATIGIQRVRVRAFKDGLVGWVTVSGNAGVTFLVPCGALFKVMKEVALTSELKVVSEADKMLQEGEVLEVLDWGRTSSSAMALTRIQVRLLVCNSVGWVTVAGTDGTILCSPA